MKMSYLSCYVTLSLLLPLAVSAADWEQSQNQLVLATDLHSNSNVFNTATGQTAARSAELGLQWDWLQLYEGYGVALPLSVKRRSYQTQQIEDVTLYEAAPELRFFLSEMTDVSVSALSSRQQFVRGDEDAEFLANDEPSLQVDSRRAQLALQIGRAPDTQNLRVNLSRSAQDQQSYRRDLQALDSDAAELRYSHKLNENVAVVLDYALRQEEQNNRATDLNQLGAGLALAWTGNQQLQLIAGRFSRKFAGESERATGNYWQLQNNWQLNQQWLLQVSSGRQSVLSIAQDSVSQLDTRHQLQLLWQPLQQHQLNFGLKRLRSVLDQRDYQRTRSSVLVGWLWQAASQWQVAVNAERVMQTRAQQIDSNRHELTLGVRWTW